MSRTIVCPEKSALLALAAGDDSSPAVRFHVGACPSCHRIVRRLRAEIVHLRSSLAPPTWSPPASIARRSPFGDN